MIARLIYWSINNRFLIVMAAVLATAWGVYSTLTIPLDAIPDLSDVQVIVRTVYPGQAPQVVEDQVTYPLTTTMLSVPYAKTVRGYSLFGESFVYVLFEDGTDLYWARSACSSTCPRCRADSRSRENRTWSRRHRSRMDLPVRARRSHRAARHLGAASAAGLVPEIRAENGAGRGGGCDDRRLRRQYQVVLDPARLRAYRLRSSRDRRASKGRTARRRVRDRTRRGRVHGARAGLPASAR